MKSLLEIFAEAAERGWLLSLYQTREEWVCNFRSADNKTLVGRGKGESPEEAANAAFENAESEPAVSAEDGDLFA